MRDGGGEAERRNCTSKRARTGGTKGWELDSGPLGWSAGSGGTGRGQWLGLGPESGKKLLAVLRQPLPLGVCSHQSALVQPGRGLDSSSGWFVEHQAPLLANTLSLVPVRRRKLPTESAHSLQGLVSEQFEFNP